MPLPDDLPAHMLDFFTLEDISDRSKFALPDNTDLPNAAVITNESLTYVSSQRGEDDPLFADPPFLETIYPEAFIGTSAALERNLFEHYHPVGDHPILDKSFRALSQPRWADEFHGPDNSDHLRTIYLRLHNGLVLLRKRKTWSAAHLSTWAARLLTYSQDKFPGEGLGQADRGRWWIAPACYAFSFRVDPPAEGEDLATTPVKFSTQGPEYKLSDERLCNQFDSAIATEHGPDRRFDLRRFTRARLTFHFVDITGAGHWVLLVRHAATNCLYLIHRVGNFQGYIVQGIVQAFNTWLEESGLAPVEGCFVTAGKISRQIETADAEAWKTPLDALADLIAFARFGVPGWEAVPAFWETELTPDKKEKVKRGKDGTPVADEVSMRWYLGESMHRLMGLRARAEVPSGPVIEREAEVDLPAEAAAGRLGKKKIIRALLRDVEKLVTEKEFMNKRRMYDLQRRTAIWARKRRAAREKQRLELEDARKWVEYFDGMEEVERWTDEYERDLVRREKEDFKTARRLRKEKLELLEESGQTLDDVPDDDSLYDEDWYLHDEKLDSEEREFDDAIEIFSIENAPWDDEKGEEEEEKPTTTKPVSPVKPTKPVSPVKPTKPAPVKPTKPVSPVKPPSPVKPGTPKLPTKPTTPTSPRREQQRRDNIHIAEQMLRRLLHDGKFNPRQRKPTSTTSRVRQVDVEKMIIRWTRDQAQKTKQPPVVRPPPTGPTHGLSTPGTTPMPPPVVRPSPTRPPPGLTTPWMTPIPPIVKDPRSPGPLPAPGQTTYYHGLTTPHTGTPTRPERPKRPKPPQPPPVIKEESESDEE